MLYGQVKHLENEKRVFDKTLPLHMYHKLKYFIFKRKLVFYRHILPPEHSFTLLASSQLTTGVH
jgi:hypothetical protein